MNTVSFSSQLVEFLQQPQFMILGTSRPDGSIQMSPVWYEYSDGVFKISTTTERVKYKNMLKDPRVTFVILDLSNPYRYVQVQGKASIAKKGAHEFIDYLSEQYTGKTPYAGDPEHKEDRVIVTITPERYNARGFE